MPILELEHVEKSYRSGFLMRRRPVLRDLSFAVETGEIFGFLGPNGAGKTTAIKLVVGLLHPDRGRIHIDGRPVQEPRARRALGYLPENPYFYEYLSGAEFLDFYARLYGLDAATRRRRARELLERLGLAAAAERPLRKYSKGMVQRLGFAQALLAAPGLLVLDEPMSGLDPIGRRDLRDLMLEARAQGSTVFFSTHILQDVELICDRVAILAAGELRSVGKLDELRAASGRGLELEVELEAGGAPGELPLPPGAELLARSGGRRLVRVPDLAAAEALAAAARGRGGRVVSQVPARASLEDVFLAEVRGGAGAAPPAGGGRP